MIAPRKTVQWLFSTYYRPQKLMAAKPKSIELYQQVLGFFDRFHNGCADVENLQPDHVYPYMAWRRAGERAPETAACCNVDCSWTEGSGQSKAQACSVCNRPLEWRKPFTKKPKKPRVWLRVPSGPATVNKELRLLKALAKFAKRRGYIQTDLEEIAFLEVPKLHKPCWWPAELASAIESAKHEQEWFFEVPASKFWPALVWVDYETGARVNAIMRTQRSDFDPLSGLIKIRAVNQKHNADQVFQLTPDAADALRAIWLPERELLFPWQWDGDGSWRCLRKRYKRILKRAGLPHDRMHLFHKIRRTTATMITREKGLAAAQSHLGHSTLRVTQGYIDQTKIPATQMASVLPRLQAVDPSQN